MPQTFKLCKTRRRQRRSEAWSLCGDRSPGPPWGWQRCAGRPSAQSQESRHAGPLGPRWLALQVSLGSSHRRLRVRGCKVETQSDRTLVHITCLGTRRARNAGGTRAACTLPPHPAGFVGFGSSPGSLSLHLFHKLELPGLLARQRGTRHSALRAGGPCACVCLPTCSLLSVGSCCLPESLPCDLQDCPVGLHAGCLRRRDLESRPSWASADLRARPSLITGSTLSPCSRLSQSRCTASN